MDKYTKSPPRSKLPAGLYVVATPIGNLQDITIRAIEILKNADAVYCEDTRQSGKLMAHFGLPTPLYTYHDHNADKVRPFLLEKLQNGEAIALISDAGTPLISDPGYKLVSACHDQHIQVYSIPGPSSPIAALSASGLPSDRFYFGGFLPTKQGERHHVLERDANILHTLIYFETPNRLIASLEDIRALMGNRVVCVARELTKTFEDIQRGTVDELLSYYKTTGVLKGEIVLLIHGAEEQVAAMNGPVTELLHELIQHMPLKKACLLLANITGIAKKDLYQKAIELKGLDD